MRGRENRGPKPGRFFIQMRVNFTYLVGSRKGQCQTFEGEEVTIGRAADNQLSLGEDQRRVSAHHAELRRLGDQWLLRDLGSTNGTMINGRRVTIAELQHDDMVEFGAGGPLLRFAIQRDNNAEPALPDHKAANPNLKTEIATRSRFLQQRSNAMLIAALCAAMLIGAFVGSFASARIRVRDSEDLSFAEIAEFNSPAVVFIRTEYEVLDSQGHVTTTESKSGSGFVVSAGGFIVTNRHVVRNWEYDSSLPGASGRITRIEVVFPHQQREEALQAELYKVAPPNQADVAILKLNSTPARVHGTEPNPAHISQGDEVVVMGYPLGTNLLDITNDTRFEPSLSTGIVSRVGQDLIQLNMRAYQGSSGGPVLNRRGDVIGILTGNLGAAPDIVLCTPIASALNLIKEDMRD